MESSHNKWLILEQESDRHDWWPSPCKNLIWNNSRASPIISHVSALNHNPDEEEICILFLPVRHNRSLLSISNSNPRLWRWNIWCHYGRDITMAELPHRWATYERLAEVDKARLMQLGSRPPLPFSRSMPQPWTEDFRKLKDKLYKLEGRSSGGEGNSFRDGLKLLHNAWALATGAQGIQQQLEHTRESLPAVLAASYLLEALPRRAGDNAPARRETLQHCLDLCEHFGLMATVHRKERFSQGVREAYRHLGFTVFSLKVLLNQPKDQFSFAAVHLVRLRRALQAFLDAANQEASTTSKALIKQL